MLSLLLLNFSFSEEVPHFPKVFHQFQPKVNKSRIKHIFLLHRREQLLLGDTCNKGSHNCSGETISVRDTNNTNDNSLGQIPHKDLVKEGISLLGSSHVDAGLDMTDFVLGKGHSCKTVWVIWSESVLPPMSISLKLSV